MKKSIQQFIQEYVVLLGQWLGKQHLLKGWSWASESLESPLNGNAYSSWLIFRFDSIKRHTSYSISSVTRSYLTSLYKMLYKFPHHRKWRLWDTEKRKTKEREHEKEHKYSSIENNKNNIRKWEKKILHKEIAQETDTMLLWDDTEKSEITVSCIQWFILIRL